MDVEEAIFALKKKFSVSTDQGLAERLSLGRSTITSWRRRNSVPERYTRLVEIDADKPFDLPIGDWRDEELQALKLALFRLTSEQHDVTTSYSQFLSKGGFLAPKFLSYLEEAFISLISEMETRGIDDPKQCVNLMVYERYFQEPA